MKIAEILDFYDVPSSFEFDLAPLEAISRFRAKGLRPTFAWQDMVDEEHALSFTVAKMLDTDLLADVHASLVNAIETGKSFGNWADELIPVLQSRGWWGRQPVIDPLSGVEVVSTLGTPARLKTIFRTNLSSAYAAGAWETITEQINEAPFLLYDAIDDWRTRPEHAAWDGRVYHANSAFWQKHYPPNGWNCRCSVIQLNEDELQDLGLEVSPRFVSGGTYEWRNPRTGKVSEIPVGIDPGFTASPTASRMALNQKLAEEKVEALPDEIKQDAIIGLQVASEQPQFKIPEWETTEEFGKWHKKAFDNSPNSIKALVANSQNVKVSYDEAPYKAWAKNGKLVNMGTTGQAWRETKQGQAVWRHEFGHIMDVRLGRGAYLSSTEEFEKSFALDRDELEQTYRVKPKSKQKNRDKEYLKIRDQLVDLDGDGRIDFLRNMALKVNIDFDNFFEFLKSETTILDQLSIRSVGNSVRAGKMLKALELKDPEEFIRQMAFTDADSKSIEFYSARKEAWSRSGSLSSMSDLIGALTKNRVCPYGPEFAGHETSYYKKSAPRANAEVFANAVDLLGNPNNLFAQIAKVFAPNVMQKIEGFINEYVQSN